MNDSKKFPFEKNRYYYGKMLTSEDFTAEQRYLDGKRSFLNRMVLGEGILCGLQVYNLDDLSILVESGAAIDGEGREIVVKESSVYRLAALKGYEEIHSERASLCLKYREEEVNPVYTPNHKENQDIWENNHIREAYEVFLQDEDEDGNILKLDSEFFVEAMLVKEDDIRIKLRIPARACRGKKVKLTMEISRDMEGEIPFSVEGLIKVPILQTSEGGHELKIETEGTLKKKDVKCVDYWLYTPDTPIDKTRLLVEAGDFSVKAGKNKIQMPESLDVEVHLTDERPEELVRKETGRTSLEILESTAWKEGIRLAELCLKKTKTGFIIHKIEGAGAKDYIPVPAKEREKEWYLSFYRDNPGDNKSMESSEQEKGEQEEFNTLKTEKREEWFNPSCSLKDYIAEGILEIPLEAGGKKGRVYYSEEVVHGLGTGNVCVLAGIADTSETAGPRPRIRTVTYGGSSLFSELDVDETWVETAVRVFRDRGTFQVAARIKGEQRTILLTVPWTAFRIPDSHENMEYERREKMYITPQTPTVRMKPKEKHYFGVDFHNMKPVRVRYQLADEKGGTIEPDGIYTASAHPGVYEIQIYCEVQKDIRTYAYAVVERELPDEA